MIKLCRRSVGEFFGAVIMASLLFVWLTGFFWQFIGLDLLVRSAELCLLVFSFRILIKSSFSLPRSSLFFIAFSIILSLVLITFLRDRNAPYTDVLYIKTFFYIVFSIFLGLAVYRYIEYSDIRKSVFLKCLGIFSLLLIGLVCVLAVLESWKPGRLLIGSYIGDSYQGVSRVIGLCVLFVVLLRRSLSSILSLSASIIGLTLLFSLNSFGAFFSIFLAASVLLKDAISDTRKFLAYLFIFLALISVVVFYLGGFEQFFNDLFWARLQEKLEFGEGDEQSRLVLAMKGFEFWLSDPASFLIGYGPMNYACAVGYCDEYRHPHNFIAELLTWFGIFGALIAGYIFYILYIAMRFYFYSKSFFENVIGVLFINYFLLAMIGGDLEQNRQFIFFASLVHISWLNRGIGYSEMEPCACWTPRQT